MAQVTFVASPLGSSVNSTVLWASNGLTKSSLIATLADVLVAFPRVLRALSAGYDAEGPFHRRVFFLPGRPGLPALKVVEQGEDLLRRSLDARRALDAESVGSGRGKNEKRGDQEGDDHGDFLEH